MAEKRLTKTKEEKKALDQNDNTMDIMSLQKLDKEKLLEVAKKLKLETTTKQSPDEIILKILTPLIFVQNTDIKENLP